MKLLSLNLLNYRNFDKLNLEFSSKKNIIIGNNGEGKTNIVEAIFVLALTKSFRTNDDDILIQDNKEYFKIEGKFDNKKIFKLVYQDDIKTVKISNKKINKLSDYVSNINVILFSFNDLKLIKDTPNTRRRLINLEISQLDNNYIKLLNSYNKILKQRNNYLKKVIKNNINYDYLNIITSQLIDYGLKIYDIRFNFINNINEYISNIFTSLGGSGKLSILYKSDYSNNSLDKLLDSYKKYIDKDLYFGSTQMGIQRDDFIFYTDFIESKNYCSEGQQKLAVISFKLAELEIFKNYVKYYPILILDDLFSELDIKKIGKILSYINDDIQLFITTTDLKKVKKSYINNCKIFRLNNGVIKEESYE